MFFRNKIFTFSTKYTVTSPNNSSIAKAIEIKFVKDPFGILKDKESLLEMQLYFTKQMLLNFNEVTLSYFDDGFRIELLPHQNASEDVIDIAGQTAEKFIAKAISEICKEKNLFTGLTFVADANAAGDYTTISVVEDI
jgi:hypothetical protein